MKKILLVLIAAVLFVGCGSSSTEEEVKSSSSEAKGGWLEPSENFTLISASISPEVITPKGSELIIQYRENTPLEDSNGLSLAIVVPDKLWNLRLVSMLEMSSNEIKTSISNSLPLTGSGTIHIYLFFPGVQRVSNILSVYAIFKPYVNGRSSQWIR